MSVQSFLADVQPDAAIASSRTGVPESVILAQWGIETGWGSSSAFRTGNNYAGVSPGGHVASYPDRAAGLFAYIQTLLLGPYAPVRAAGDPTSAAVALGNSPWAASHYGGGGTQLLDVMRQFDLTQFDTGTAGPPSPATPASPSSGNGTTNVGLTLNPLSLANTVAGAVVDQLTNALRKPMLTAVAVAGGMALIALGGWRAVQPTVTKVQDRAEKVAGDVAKVAAVA